MSLHLFQLEVKSLEMGTIRILSFIQTIQEVTDFTGFQVD